MNQPASGLIKRMTLSLLILLTLPGCGLVSDLITTPSTSTSTSENCSFNWAYGPGSTEFDQAVTKMLTDEGISSIIKSSSYGEIYSCDQSFAAMALDVKVDIKVADFTDQDKLTNLADNLFSTLKENLSISTVNNLGNVSLTFTSSNGNTCYWNNDQKQCAE